MESGESRAEGIRDLLVDGQSYRAILSRVWGYQWDVLRDGASAETHRIRRQKPQSGLQAC
jgi:hypothetical protein